VELISSVVVAVPSDYTRYIRTNCVLMQIAREIVKQGSANRHHSPFVKSMRVLTNHARRHFEKRYSPAECIGAVKHRVEGNPDPNHVSTSYAERNNLNVRMHSRRLTWLTNAFSKKIENHAHAMALHVMYYNFVRIHKTLRTTPAMAAGVTKRLWEIGDIVDIIEAFETAQKRAA
jgi:hypothetical protein